MEGLYTPAETANPDVIRSWKDPRYRRSLSAQQLLTLPQHPAGPGALTEQEFMAAAGVMPGEDELAILTTAFDCTDITFRNWKACGC